MYYIYIIYSDSANLYYVGYTNDPKRRLIEHNTNPHNTFTSKHRPWVMKALFECGMSESQDYNHMSDLLKSKRAGN